MHTLFFFNKNVVFPAQAEYSYFSADFRLNIFLLPTSQPSEDARLARRQRIVPREGCCMQKNSRSTYEKCKCKV